MALSQSSPGRLNFGFAYLLMCFAMAIHTWDEATHHFVEYFNATALVLYGHFSWFPDLQMNLQTFVAGLAIANLLLFALTPMAYRNSRYLRPLAYGFGGGFFLNGIWHILLTLKGSSVGSIHFEGVAPGFYTSPLLLIFGGYLLWSLRRSASPPKA